MEGTVFDIQHYCIHDGPGIRTNVFLKGCPLNCLWCQNPESKKIKPELMYNEDRCTACMKCIEVCHSGAITVEKNCEDDSYKIVTDRKKCVACGNCVDACYSDARKITGKKMTVEEILEEIKEDVIFFGDEGGVTVTGGEPYAQADFATEILKACHMEGITTCIETCGYVSSEKLKKSAEYIDLFLYDIKHMDSKEHEKCTGVGNEIILDNLKILSEELKKKVMIRVPVIPGYNDTADNIDAMARFIKVSVPTCIGVNLLPYHRLGEGKLQQLEEETDFVSRPPTDAEMDNLKSIVSSYGIKVI